MDDTRRRLLSHVANGFDPRMALKMCLAWEIVSQFHGDEQADKAEQGFIAKYCGHRFVTRSGEDG